MDLHKDIRLDFDRRSRMGLEEAILASGKTVAHLNTILDEAADKRARFLITRLAVEQLDALPDHHRNRIHYDALSRTGYFGDPEPLCTETRVAVVAAGTSDVNLVREILPTVVGGLVPGVVIGCPSSVGYGVAEKGSSALNAMLASCAAGLLVTNIDNGFGAACAALRVLRTIGR
jgi:NCAIR mutase (PurE)-related protein